MKTFMFFCIFRDRIRQGVNKMLGFLCLSSLQFPEELQKNRLRSRAKSEERDRSKDRWLWMGHCFAQTRFSLKCTISIRAFLQMLMVRAFSVKRSTLIPHYTSKVCLLLIFTTECFQHKTSQV